MAYGIAAAGIVAIFVAWRFIGPTWRESRQQADLLRWQKEFRGQRERLEAMFFDRASRSGKPRGLRWKDCDFGDAVVYARDRRTLCLLAFVGVTLSFEAIEGGPMEEVEAVGNLRAATAFFRHDGRSWHTDGRVLFNLDPSEAIAHYQGEVEAVSLPSPAA